MTTPTIISPHETIGVFSMVSGVGEQESVELYDAYRSLKPNSQGFITHWYVGRKPNAADFVYCRMEGNYVSQGFAGRRMTFQLDGGSVEEQGPWHGNAESLFRDTGVDIRDKYFTMGVLGLAPDNTWKHYAASDVIYFDKEWILGKYERVDELAQEFANKYGVTIYGWMMGTGGGHSICVKPEDYMIKLIERELIQDGERITGVSAYRWKESRWEYAGVWYMPQEEWLKLRGCIEVGLEDNPLNYLSFRVQHHESQRPRDEFKRGDPGHPDNDMGM